MSAKSRASVILCSAALLLTICTAVLFLYEPGDRLYDFFFKRSVVQYFTLSAFALAASLLGRRAYLCARDRGDLSAAKKGESSWQARRGPMGLQYAAVRTTLMQRGSVAALSYAKQAAEKNRDRIQQAYDSINSLLCLLPALGILGTMLGLSGSLFRAYSRTNMDSAQAAQQFAVSLSTALDCTILALVCAMIIGGVSWLLHNREKQVADQQEDRIRQALSLDGFVPSDASVPSSAGGSAQGGYGGAHASSTTETTEVFRAELRALTAEIVQDAKSSFEESLQSVAASFRSGLDTAVKEIFSRQRAREEALIEKLVGKVADRLTESVDRIRGLLEKQNGHLSSHLTSQLRELDKTLRRRVPSEVTIRYENNGQTHHGQHHPHQPQQPTADLDAQVTGD